MRNFRRVRNASQTEEGIFRTERVPNLNRPKGKANKEDELIVMK